MAKIRALNIKKRRPRWGFVPKNKKTLKQAEMTIPEGINAKFYKGVGDIPIECDHPEARSLKSQDGLVPLKVISGNVRSHEDRICKSCQDIRKGCYEYLP